MQRKPVPSGLIRCQVLAAPFPIHPCLSGNLNGFFVDGDAARGLEIRLAEIIRGLSAVRFLAVAGIALQNQRAIGVKPERISEIRSRSADLKRRDALVA